MQIETDNKLKSADDKNQAINLTMFIQTKIEEEEEFKLIARE